MKFTMTEPCSKCPFRTDVGAYLTTHRMRDIIESGATFQCHQTVDYKEADENGEVDGMVAAEEKNAQHCAGLLILLERIERPHQMMRIAERIGLYDRRRLNMDAPIFKTARAAVSAQRKR